MQNLFDEKEAEKFSGDPLAMRVYTSRLLGQSEDLVLHGGGNTSVKIGDTLYVKGSGWNLSSIEKAGFSPVDLSSLIEMAAREELSDTEMVKEQRAALRDPSAPNPSIEAILHAIIPFDYVDHTHADAVVTISNTPEGREILQELYGENMLIVDYVMPGFILAKQIYGLTKDIDWGSLDGILLLNHGLFTFDDNAEKSYRKHIELVTMAEEYIYEAALLSPQCISGEIAPDVLSRLTERVSELQKMPVVSKELYSTDVCSFSKNPNIENIVHKGGLTPEHVIRIKPFPAIIDEDVDAGIDTFVKEYREYFEKYASKEHICLDPAPRYAVIRGVGAITFGKDEKEAKIIADIVEHTLKAMLIAEELGGWQSLSPKELFDMEYWELEQNKIKNSG